MEERREREDRVEKRKVSRGKKIEEITQIGREKGKQRKEARARIEWRKEKKAEERRESGGKKLERG